MKKFLASVCLLSIVSLVNAQEVKFGIKAGLNLATISTKEDGNNIDKKNVVPNFHAGVFVDLPMIGEVLSLQPGVYFTGKGSKVSYEILNERFTVSNNPYYVEGRANLMAKIPFNSFKLYVGAGPYLAYGVCGNVKVTSSVSDDPLFDQKIKFTKDKQIIEEIAGAYLAMKPWDVGFNITAGMEFNSFLISANYGHGLLSIRPSIDNSDSNISNLYKDNKDKNRVFSVSLGIKF
jgi:hypothetical protein